MYAGVDASVDSAASPRYAQSPTAFSFIAGRSRQRIHIWFRLQLYKILGAASPKSLASNGYPTQITIATQTQPVTRQSCYISPSKTYNQVPSRSVNGYTTTMPSGSSKQAAKQKPSELATETKRQITPWVKANEEHRWPVQSYLFTHPISQCAQRFEETRPTSLGPPTFCKSESTITQHQEIIPTGFAIAALNLFAPNLVLPMAGHRLCCASSVTHTRHKPRYHTYRHA